MSTAYPVAASRTGNRQLNCALHRIALTQARYYEPAQDFPARRREKGDTSRRARRAFKRKLSNVIYRTLLLDASNCDSVSLERVAWHRSKS